MSVLVYVLVLAAVLVLGVGINPPSVATRQRRMFKQLNDRRRTT